MESLRLERLEFAKEQTKVRVLRFDRYPLFVLSDIGN
jgi:hypothetical protein